MDEQPQPESAANPSDTPGGEIPPQPSHAGESDPPASETPAATDVERRFAQLADGDALFADPAVRALTMAYALCSGKSDDLESAAKDMQRHYAHVSSMLHTPPKPAAASQTLAPVLGSTVHAPAARPRKIESIEQAAQATARLLEQAWGAA